MEMIFLVMLVPPACTQTETCSIAPSASR